MKACMYSSTVLLAVALAGCAATESAPFRAENNPYLSQGRVQFESSTTKHILDVVGVDAQRLDSGLLKVVLTVRNRTKENLWVDIRTTFLDDRGHALERTNWESILLDHRTISEYICTSLNGRASDYQVIIRKPNKTSLGMP